MSYSVDYMREDIASVYKGMAWKDKVSKMSDQQVMAIYFSFCEKGKFDNPKQQPVKAKINEKPSEDDTYFAEQLFMDGIFI